MPRKRLPEGERKERLNIRLKQELIDKLEKLGDLQEVVEKACIEYLKKKS